MVKDKVEFNVDVELRAPIVGLIMSKSDFVIRMPNGIRDRIVKHMEELKEKRGDWPGYMYKELEHRMRFTGVNLDAKGLDFNTLLVDFGEKFVKLTGFDPTPEQKTIEEATAEAQKNGGSKDKSG